MPSGFTNLHKTKKDLNMPERTECHELKQMYNTRLGREHNRKDYNIHSDHMNVYKQEPTYNKDIDFYKEL